MIRARNRNPNEAALKEIRHLAQETCSNQLRELGNGIDPDMVAEADLEHLRRIHELQTTEHE